MNYNSGAGGNNAIFGQGSIIEVGKSEFDGAEGHAAGLLSLLAAGDAAVQVLKAESENPASPAKDAARTLLDLLIFCPEIEGHAQVSLIADQVEK